ncbi:MAG TPA: hypothetical protein VGI12_01845 [Vicinamibacterales bacterium]
MTRYRGRRAFSIENGTLRVTVLAEGGHIAEICDLATGVNPLWTPHWPSIEPSEYDAARHPEYGGGADASLLAGIMGHNLCLDVFGGPSAAEAAAGLPAHGEASVARWEIDAAADAIAMTTVLPSAGLRVARRIRIDGRTVQIRERLENASRIDRPIGWTQHVTLGPPFLEPAVTRFDVTADRSLVFPGPFGPADYLQPGAEFAWPDAPKHEGGAADLGTYTSARCSSAYTAHRLDPERETAWFIAFSPRLRLAFGYIWRRTDFPWLGMWEENRSRTAAPWNGQAITCGLEFGVSPLPETRQQMIERGPTFGTPGCRWIQAGQAVEVEYRAVLRPAATLPASLE